MSGGVGGASISRPRSSGVQLDCGNDELVWVGESQMRSRWFHRPHFHSTALGLQKRATWLELFYDLIFVAAFIQLGNGLSEHVSVFGALAFAGAFVPLWVAWTGLTFFINRYTVDDFAHRILVFFQMFAVGGMAIGASTVVGGEVAGFSLFTGVAQLIVSLLNWRAYYQVPETRAYARYWGRVFALSGIAWVIAAWLPSGLAFGLWAIATLMVLMAPLSRQSLELSDRQPYDFHHLAERYALLTLIVLGESFVKILSALSAEKQGLPLYAQTAVLLSITCGMWWVYFDDIAESHLKPGRARWIVWLYAHLPVQIGFTGMGVAIKKALHFNWDVAAPDGYRWLLAGFVSLALFGVAALDTVTERKHAQITDRARTNMRLFSGCVVLVLAPAGGGMSGGLFLTLVTVLVVSQVVFDMMLAPLQESAEAELGKQSLTQIAKRSAAGGQAVRLRRDMSQTVRKGAPSELRGDLYFYFMSGGWTRVFVSLGFAFLAVNVFFAALYTFEVDAIGNGRQRSFADAFFLSVQTMSTIGYGSLYPKSDYANAVASIQAAFSMIGVAIVTGFIFAKASRPRASVLFSKPVTITKLHGKPTLMLRVGNARGNDLVDASMELVVLKDELSPEGEHLRRLHSVELQRSRSPMFVLSWTAMHVIDDDSPFAGVDWNEPERYLISIVVTLLGHDGTYGQTTYARHTYLPQDIRVGHRFVDVLEELEDGRMMIDYSKFHDTRDEPQIRAELCSLAGRTTREQLDDPGPVMDSEGEKV